MEIKPYTEFSYIFPPRTKSKIPFDGPVKDMWAKYDDVFAQFKLNGTRLEIVKYPDAHYELWTRHKELQKRYTLTTAQKSSLDALPLTPGQFHILDGELLHSKTRNVKDVIYLFDVLVLNGFHLLGQTYYERYTALHELVPNYFPRDMKPTSGESYIAENFAPDKWDWMWEVAKNVDYCEGIVLKRGSNVSRLEPGYKELNNGAFMCRIRKSSKNYLL